MKVFDKNIYPIKTFIKTDRCEENVDGGCLYSGCTVIKELSELGNIRI